jgi:hypothetical protein
LTRGEVYIGHYFWGTLREDEVGKHTDPSLRKKRKATWSLFRWTRSNSDPGQHGTQTTALPQQIQEVDFSLVIGHICSV